MNVHFEGGLQGQYTSRSPLMRDSQLYPLGDTYSAIPTPEPND